MNNELSHKYAVVYKDTRKIYKTFEYWGEALHCITDSFGPEGDKVEAVELPTYSPIM